jgi:PAS domain S-box-containing protein
MALVIVAVSLGMFVALIPFADQRLAPAAWFIPLHQPVLAINDLITATLLFGYLRLTRRTAVLVLACGYLYSAVMAIVHMLSFPGVFSPAGLFGAGGQSTGYLHVFWHIGFPLAAIGYALLKDGERKVEKLATAGALAVGLTLACAALLSLLAIAGIDWLPPMLAGARYSSAFNIGRYGQWIATAAALGVLLTRRSSSTLDLWLGVVLAAWFFEIGLVSIVNAGRWDVGFYAGRCYALVASSLVLVILLSEQNRMYRELAEAHVKARLAHHLNERRKVLRLALEAGKMGVFSWDIQNRRTWWSPEFERIVGVPEGTLATDPEALMRYVLPEDRDALRASLRECIVARKDCAVEFRMRNAHGDVLWAAVRGEAAADAQDQPGLMFGVLVDVTERKRGEEAAAELEAQLRTLVDEIPQVAWMARPDGWIDWHNRRWFEYTGMTPAQAEGWGWQRAHDPGLQAQLDARWRRAIETGMPFEMTMPMRAADGSYRQFLSRAVPLHDAEGHIIRWFGTHTDIQARSEAEQALKLADQRKDEFLATLAHELRNPLAPIRNAVELLSRTAQAPPPVARAMAIIDRQSRHLSRLVDDLLEVSRITQGKVTLRKKTVSLVECLSDALQAVELALKAAGHEVTVHLSEDAMLASVDSTRIVQCFLNLLNNAIKFTPHGGRIGVEAERIGNQARITFTDSGIGIPPANLEDIFGLFAQVTPALERSQGGLGIGLSLVKGFVELHGGTVVAASEGVGHGSRFTVTLPLLEPQALAPHTLADAGHAASHPPRRVLVVDDNRDAAASMVALLQAAGHEVSEANDGPEALRLAFAHEPDVILLDIGMPGMNGLEVARELRKQNLHVSPRIIAVTGWGQDKDRVLTRDAGFDFHLTKPVNHTELDMLLSMAPSLPRPAVHERPALRH